MSLSLINKIYGNKPLVWGNQFFTIKEITLINDEKEILNLIITGMVDKEDSVLTCTYDEFFEAIK